MGEKLNLLIKSIAYHDEIRLAGQFGSPPAFSALSVMARWEFAMSRGHGKIQARLLAILHAQSPRARIRGLDTVELAKRVYHRFAKFHEWPEPKHEVAVRRALASLAREGLVIRLGIRPSGRCHWRACKRP